MTEDRSHNASEDPRQAGTAERLAAKKDADLDALLQSWSAETEAEPAPARGMDVRLRLISTILIVLLAGGVMFMTRKDFSWWLEPSTPQAIGDVRALYRSNTPLPTMENNSHVSISGLVPTRLIPVKLEGLSDGSVADTPMEYIFYCPLAQTLVVTNQPIEMPADRLITVDPAFEKLLTERLAFPENLAVEVAVTGRLRRPEEGPRALTPFVDRVVRRLGIDTSNIWVLEDGRRPSEASWAAIVWALSTVGMSLSIFFLVRALRRRNIVPPA